MRRSRDLAVWALVGVAGAAALAWAFPRVFPLYPAEWSVSKQEAEAIALERFRDLGPPVEDGLVVSALRTASTLERRMLETAAAGAEVERLRETLMARELLSWWVRVYPPGARPSDWTYRAIVAADGEVVDLELRVPPGQALPDADPDAAEARAREVLAAEGFDPSAFGEPVLRRAELQGRSDLAVRFPIAEPAFGPEVPYGIEVTFAGDRWTGFRSWMDEPERARLAAVLQPINLLAQFRIMVPFLILPFVVVLFLRRYHQGEVGVRRAVHIFLVVFGAGVVLIGLAGASATEGQDWGGVLSRVQVAWAWGLQILVFWFPALGLLAAASWAVGEAICREGAPGKLAAFDALFRGAWTNATFARSAFRGLGAGLGLAGALLALLLVPGAEAQFTALLGPWWESARWAGLALIGFLVAYVGACELFARLFLLSALTRRTGPWVAGVLVTALSALLFWPPISGIGIGSSLAVGLVAAAALVGLFVAYDLLTALVASLTAFAACAVLPLLFADDPFLQLQGALPLAFVALPALVSLRHLLSDRELVYRWEDVPPHVRRIAERERQRVELETARGIQSSILPELPPSLQGVELAHAYLPANEVGGDFYDVLALQDGRLALAVGDVAGHGVSSGLVMSMAKSALAVQVSFDPRVSEVFRTLNRTVYQSARQRLLTTLCYAVLDPVRRELLYASAGHLFPYRLSRDGRVEALESVAYPLGVRGDLEVMAKEARLEEGDTLFLFSDGIVEARRDGSDELFGFERLEAALRRHAHMPVARLRDAVLAEVEEFSGGTPREDDQTVLVLRLP